MKPEVTAPLVLRSYIWGLLKANTEMDLEDYRNSENPQGLVPIVPAQEEPELAEFDKPYLVFGYVENASRDLYKKRSGSITFVVRSTSFREIGNIINILNTAFERWDEAAKDVNRYTSTIPAFAGLRFGSISVGYAEGGTPDANDQDTAQTEGGRSSGIITLNYEYFSEAAVVTDHTKWA